MTLNEQFDTASEQNVLVEPEAGKVCGADVGDKEILHPGAFSSAATVPTVAPLTISAMDAICTTELVFAVAVRGTATEVLVFGEITEAVRNEAPASGVIKTLHVHPTSLKVTFRVPLPPDGYMK